MLKKHSIFQILYIIVGPLCPASLKRFVFYNVPPSDKHKPRLMQIFPHRDVDMWGHVWMSRFKGGMAES